jgi:radical SAM superfamily enzyme YgiQ (UPF0313 family)
MNKKSIIYLEPRGSEANVFDNYMKLPLMGGLYLGTILHNAGYSVRILNENLLGRRISPFELSADYLCISCLTLTSNRAKELALKAREIFPEMKIIFGGIHPSLLTEEFVGLADHVVVGEAENIIIDIIAGKYTEKIIYGKAVENLDDLPLVNYGLLEGYKKMNIIPVMTSRGCPFDCNFCTVTKIFGRAFRNQSVKRVIAELKNAFSYYDIRDIFFYDDNFTADKARAFELMEAINREKMRIIWTAQVRADIAKDEKLLASMYDAGCNRVFIGFESINDETLRALKKSQTRKDIENAIDLIHKHGINIHGMFILGEDNDTVGNIEMTADFAVEHNVDTVQFMILTPFPCTQLYEKLDSEHRLLHRDWDYYDGMHVTFKPKNITPVKLQEEATKCYKKFYSIERVFLESLYVGINMIHDALLWNFNSVYKYDLNTFYIRIGAKYILHKYLKLSRAYFNYLSARS